MNRRPVVYVRQRRRDWGLILFLLGLLLLVTSALVWQLLKQGQPMVINGEQAPLGNVLAVPTVVQGQPMEPVMPVVIAPAGADSYTESGEVEMLHNSPRSAAEVEATATAVAVEYGVEFVQACMLARVENRRGHPRCSDAIEALGQGR